MKVATFLIAFALSPLLSGEPAPQGVLQLSQKDLAAENLFASGEESGWLPDRPNVLALALPEGNHTITITHEGPLTVKAEDRRLMTLVPPSPQEKFLQFTVNTRSPALQDGREVRLRKPEDRTGFTWDDKLTLEFFPHAKGITGIEVVAAEAASTVFLAGDSTVTDQNREPWAGWGQMLPAFFDSGVAIANHAESGRALFSFRGERRLQKILEAAREGDYVLVQFGHNDQKDKRAEAGPFTTYRADLEDFIARIRATGAQPVLVTPMERRRWSEGKPGQTLSDYAAAVRQVGEAEEVPVLDLHIRSLELYTALGEEGSREAFVHYPAHTFPEQHEALRDDTHHSNYGAYELARCLVEEIRVHLPALAGSLRPGIAAFDPRKPEAAGTVQLPAGLPQASEKPEGN
ncbi:rhamnogalacturonan acetylesterase [Roseibacillus ishigakijimensis]|uniref:Rhamnogalacturonan acetylesterase n=1 Tax=Roseibacillus ishigakijimensis TaxID=454146 RepID=A0A934RT88_9BACT|nr:rhamnogalacturonan acetylesterase [Roseibacillus ishigakijimensis]MBK1835211.1 rhamnogalacturonan acetylesterase [Roseibacillus ishigakijimensis]